MFWNMLEIIEVDLETSCFWLTGSIFPVEDLFPSVLFRPT